MKTLLRFFRKPPSQPPSTPSNVSIVLVMLGITTFLAGSGERKQSWKAGSLVVAVFSFISAAILAIAGDRRWTRVFVAVSFISNLIASRRVVARIRSLKSKRSLWQRIVPRAIALLRIRPAEVTWTPGAKRAHATTAL